MDAEESSTPVFKAYVKKILVLAISLAIVYIGIVGLRKRFAFLSDVAPKNYEELLKRDRSIIRSEIKSEPDYFESVRRLAEQNDPNALKKIEEYLNSDNPVMYKLGVQGLGYFKDPALEDRLFEIITQNEDENIKILGLQSLAKKKIQRRADWIKNFLNNIKKDTLLYIVAIESLMKISSEEALRLWVKTELLRIFQIQGQVNRSVVLTILCQNFLKDENIQKTVKDLLRSDENIEDVQIALAALVHSGDDWLAKNLFSLIKNKNPFYLVEVIQILHMLCPPNRYEIIKWFLNNEHRKYLILDLLKEIEMLNDDNLLPLLQDERKNKKWIAEHLFEIDNTLAVLKSSQEQKKVNPQLRPYCNSKDLR